MARMSREMQSHAMSDAFRAHQSEEKSKKAAPEKKVARSQAKEFSEEQMIGASVADQLMDAYKRDPDMKAMFAEDPKKAEELRDALAEKAGSGASKMAMAEYAAETIEKMFALPTVVGSAEEGESQKAA